MRIFPYKSHEKSPFAHRNTPVWYREGGRTVGSGRVATILHWAIKYFLSIHWLNWLSLIKKECSEADEKLTDKKKEVERAQSELNNLEATKAEAEEQKRVAEEVRAEIVAGADYGDLVDKVVNLTYENQKLQEENRGLRYKLNEAYEFMKQFVINGRNMLEVFRERIGEVKEWVRQKVAGWYNDRSVEPKIIVYRNWNEPELSDIYMLEGFFA